MQKRGSLGLRTSHQRSLSKAALSFAIILAAWAVLVNGGLVQPFFLPPPGAVFASIASDLQQLAIYKDILDTTLRALTGLLISAILGIPIGVVLGRYQRLYEYVNLPVDFFRSVPSSALFFLFILIFGIGDAAKIAVVVYGCSLILLVSAAYGARQTREKRDRENMLRSFRASPTQVFLYVVLPDAWPHIAAGLRVCGSLAFVLVVVTEMFLTAESGIGRRIYDAYLAYRIADMYGAIIVLGIVGYLVNNALSTMERRTCFWMSDD